MLCFNTGIALSFHKSPEPDTGIAIFYTRKAKTPYMILRNEPRNQPEKNFTDPIQLLQYLELKREQSPFSESAMESFRFKVPVAFAQKMQPGKADDPLLLQVFPAPEELNDHNDYQNDPLAEARFLSQPGLLQKYHGRALLLVTPSCAIHCRYCFRRHYPYDDKGHSQTQLDNNLRLIEHDTSISEVILSGGDPLSLSDTRLKRLFEQLQAIKHLQRIRIHSRYPVVEPERVTTALLNTLKQSRLQVMMVLHINHAHEIGADNQQVFHQLLNNNILLFNQSVLLKGVNDSPEALAELSEILIQHHIIPYYLHMLDKVHGSAYFEISEHAALDIYKQLRSLLPGYMLPRLVREIPDASAKMPLYP